MFPGRALLPTYFSTFFNPAAYSAKNSGPTTARGRDSTPGRKNQIKYQLKNPDRMTIIFSGG
jgi:hypothetical protein